MLGLLQAVLSPGEGKTIEKALASGNAPIMMCGLGSQSRAVMAAAIAARTMRPVAVLTADENSALTFAADASAARGSEFGILPAREPVFHSVEGISREWEHKRTDIFNRMLCGTLGGVVGSVEAFLLRTMPPERFAENVLTLEVGQTVDAGELASKLTVLGYRRAELVEGMGQFAMRGGIVDIFPPGCVRPVRMELFGDEIDSMGSFDTETQRRTENLQRIGIPPACELPPALADGGRSGFYEAIRGLLRGAGKSKLPPKYIDTVMADSDSCLTGIGFSAADRYLPQAYKSFACGLDYLPDNAVILIDDMPRVRDAVRRLARTMNETLAHLMDEGVVGGRQVGFYLSEQELMGRLTASSAIMLSDFVHQCDDVRPKEIMSFSFREMPSGNGNIDMLVSDIQRYQKADYATVVLAVSAARAEHLQVLLEEKGIYAQPDKGFTDVPDRGAVMISVGELPNGLEIPGAGLAVLADGVGRRATGEVSGRRQREKTDKKNRIRYYTDLKPGDAVVHERHGIGRFTGITQMETEGVLKDYLRIQYAGTDVLYVPVTQLDALTKYFGAGEQEGVKLSKLGGTDWAKTKLKAKAAAKELAKELIALYARRTKLPGYAFGKDGAWQKEFEDGFEYAETEDQLKAAEEIKKDMERPVPMDRLLCGDVGFGKTEVAFRAAMKAMLDSKQVALLVPTTVLARQHYVTALRRFRGYPVKIASLSRFSTKASADETLRKLASGQIDMVIGTHKLLGKAVRFHDLGLVIVDEEQRFGVSHKEKLKQISQGADVLTLTATPIPRTLNMALTGIRDMSVLEESPRDRYPVDTYVCEYDELTIRDAISRELSRGGQVYYMHNRVDSIYHCADVLHKSMPEARILVGHGKMDERELSEVMRAFTEGEADVLVCTTIIETGIDIPNVNTLIIEDADRLGLAQLHQIRGRVGRSSRHAYAYLTYRRGSVLTEVAQKRLGAMRDFAEFGAGFRIAMRDLEIRGAGNLLGAEQSGHILSVGYEMYMKLLEEAVVEEKGGKPTQTKECRLDIAVSAGIPEGYISSAYERMDFYRRIALLTTQEDIRDMQDEMTDRYGDLPKVTMSLLQISYLRHRAEALSIEDIQEKEGEIRIRFGPNLVERLTDTLAHPELRSRIFVRPGEQPCLCLRVRRQDDRLKLLDITLTCLAGGEH